MITAALTIPNEDATTSRLGLFIISGGFCFFPSRYDLLKIWERQAKAQHEG
jgi:hypothetical protein